MRRRRRRRSKPISALALAIHAPKYAICITCLPPGFRLTIAPPFPSPLSPVDFPFPKFVVMRYTQSVSAARSGSRRQYDMRRWTLPRPPMIYQNSPAMLNVMRKYAKVTFWNEAEASHAIQTIETQRIRVMSCTVVRCFLVLVLLILSSSDLVTSSRVRCLDVRCLCRLREFPPLR